MIHCDKYLVLVLVFLSSWYHPSQCSSDSQDPEDLPSDTPHLLKMVLTNSTVILDCRIFNETIRDSNVTTWFPYERDANRQYVPAAHIKNSKAIKVVNGSLVILRAAKEDSGFYECIARGGVSKMIQLSVIEPPPAPKILHKAQIVQDQVLQVAENDTLHLTCLSAGTHPAPVLSWVSNSAELQLVATQQHSGTLNLTVQMTKQLDYVSISCVAKFAAVPHLVLTSTPVRLVIEDRTHCDWNTFGWGAGAGALVVVFLLLLVRFCPRCFGSNKETNYKTGTGTGPEEMMGFSYAQLYV